MSSAPSARMCDTTHTHHGRIRSDEYSWMRAANWQDVMQSPSLLASDIRAHLEAENTYCSSVLAPVSGLHETLVSEMRGRIDPDAASVPCDQGDYAWGTRYASSEHPFVYRSERGGGAGGGVTVLDFNREARDKDYFKPGVYIPSPDNYYLAWCFDDKGSEYFEVRVRDCATQCDLSETLVGTSGSLAWDATGSFLFYVLLDSNHRPARVMRHKLGTVQAADIEVYHEHDPGFFVSVSLSLSHRFIVITCHTHETSEVWLIDAHAASDSVAHCVLERHLGVEYQIIDDVARFQLLMLTNLDAQDFRIMSAPFPSLVSDITTLSLDWTPLIEHVSGSLILDVIAFRDHIVWLRRCDALPQIEVYTPAAGSVERIAFSEEAYALDILDSFEYESSILRFVFSSMTTPHETYDYDLKSGRRTLRLRQCVPSGHSSSDYVTRRLSIPSIEGVCVPLSLVYHKDTLLDGHAPVLLYGYGAYGITIPASFETSRLSLIDRGFIYAIAHIRGGSACGRAWFEGGRGKHKTNSFDDFVYCARGLIDRGLARPGGISIHGGSAGGMLVGAVMNYATDLFCGAVAEVPFVDVLNTMLDADLPLTPPEWPEWGNPILSAEAYDRIASYSPYENIGRHSYPHIFASGGLTDPRVTYWEPAKWISRLRRLRTDSGLTLLHTEMSAGHGGRAGRYNRLQEIAMAYSFLLLIHEREDAHHVTDTN